MQGGFTVVRWLLVVVVVVVVVVVARGRGYSS